MATNTSINVGIRRDFATLGARNFEPAGTVQYSCLHEGLNFLGTQYHIGDSLPFDNGSAYTATAVAQLQLFWDQGWLTPLT